VLITLKFFLVKLNHSDELILANTMNNDILSFYSESPNRSPGLGPHERISSMSRYKQLEQILNWRQKLSNFAVAPFTLDKKTWRTVEHYFQAQKLKLVSPELAETFTVESGTYLGTEGSGLDARKMRKAKFLSKELLTIWDSEKDTVMVRAWEAKFSQNAEMKEVLLATGEAELCHSGPRIPLQRFVGLETLRTSLRSSFCL
jgi:ribA/ribD-fused uncharacterized protein